MKTKSLFLTLVLLALGGSLSAQKLTGSPGTLVGGDMNASSAACATARSCVWATLSPNASSLSVTLSGTWSATVLAEQSADGGTTWTTVAASLANGLTTYTVTSMTDFRVRVSAYTSGIASVTLSIGLLQVQSVVAGGSSGVVGGTFGASPSSGYTFTSTPITLAPLAGDLLVGANINGNATGTYTPGAGYTLIGTSQIVLGMEYQLAGAATSYSAPFTYSVNSGNWGGTIATFAPSGTPALVQGRTVAAAATLAYTSNNGAGNLLVAVFRYNNGAPIVSVADTRGNTWVSAGARCFEGYALGASDSNNLEVWYAMNSIAGANTVTPTYGAGNTGGVANYIGIGEFSGVALTNALVDYNFTGSTTSVTSIPGATTNPQYTINAVNNKTGVVDFTGRDFGLVFRTAANAMPAPGLMYRKNGVYPGQTSVQENTGGQTNWYIWGTPAPAGGNQGSWHIECESFTQILYTSSQTNGCIDWVMPSAYAGPQPTSNTLSGFWQRPSSGAFGPAIFFKYGTVRIPDNKHTPSNSYDTFMAVYSSHIGTVADTVIVAADQACSGLGAATSNVNGFRSNQSQTDETYFDNTWAIGFDTPYNVLSNHPIGIQMHAVCSANAGKFTSSSTVYGGMLFHFQDIHNANGIQFSCGFPGQRWDSLNMIVENLTSGAFSRVGNASEGGTLGFCVGSITVSTQAAGGSYAVPAFFNAGSGVNFTVAEGARTYQQGLINSNFTSAATPGTAKQTLATYNFIFNSSFTAAQGGPFLNNTGAVVHIKAWGITVNNANSKVFQLDFGGTTIATITATINIAGSVKCEADIIVSSVANVQEVIGYCDDGATRTVTRSAPGITGSATITLNAAATTAGAAGDFTFKGWTIEYLGGR